MISGQFIAVGEETITKTCRGKYQNLSETMRCANQTRTGKTINPCGWYPMQCCNVPTQCGAAIEEQKAPRRAIYCSKICVGKCQRVIPIPTTHPKPQCGCAHCWQARTGRPQKLRRRRQGRTKPKAEERNDRGLTIHRARVNFGVPGLRCHD